MDLIKRLAKFEYNRGVTVIKTTSAIGTPDCLQPDAKRVKLASKLWRPCAVPHNAFRAPYLLRHLLESSWIAK